MSKGHQGDVDGHTHIGSQVIPPFGGGTATAETEAEPSASDPLAGGFNLTAGTAMPGITTPDRIDSDDNNIQITTSVGTRSLPPEQMAYLQQQLKLAGMLPAEFKGNGALGPETAAALRKLKETSRMTGTSDLDTLRTIIEQNAQIEVMGEQEKAAAKINVDRSGVRRTTQTNEAMFTDPATVRDTLRTAMESRLGRAATAAEEAQFRAALRAEEGGDSVSTTQTVYGRKGNPKSSYTSQADDTTDASASVMADAFTRQGKLGREANTRMAGVDYYGAILSLPGMGS